MTATPDRDRRCVPVWAWLLLFGVALCALPWVGAESLSLESLYKHMTGAPTTHGMILFGQRIPRVLLALVVGGTLALTGAALQVLFRNPLAEPWTLGVAGGAAMGAFAAQAIPWLHVSWGWFGSPQLFALLGAAGVMVLVATYAPRYGSMSAHSLLLAGVTVSVVSGGVIMLLTYFISPYEFVAFHRWMMGGLDVVGYRDVGAVLIVGVPGIVMMLSQARELNHMALNADVAMGHGVDVVRVQRLVFVGAGLATAGCVAVAGPIAFVGMIMPHIVRRLGGVDHRFVLPASFLLGGAALGVCDAIARTAIAPTEIPVGVITAVLGGPVFLYLLGRR